MNTKFLKTNRLKIGAFHAFENTGKTLVFYFLGMPFARHIRFKTFD